MSTIKVDTIATRTGSGNITLSNNVASLTSAGAISGTNLSASGALAVTGNTTVGGTLVNTGLVTASAGVAIGGTGSANTLDDYEEGTWSPTYIGDSSNPTVSFTTQIGRYTKVGRLVTILGYLRVNSFSGGGGGLAIGSLPFQNGSTTYVAATVGYVSAWSSGTNAPTRLLAHPDNPKLTVYRQSTSDPRSPIERVQVSNLANGCELYFSAVYSTA